MVTDTDDRRRGDTQERRRFGRFATRLPISTHRDDLVKRGQARGRAQCRLHLQDFSLGGLRAESPIPLKVNERLTLRLPPSGTHPALQLTGRVIHCHRLNRGYQVGIEFRQTREDAATSPFRHLPRLFSVAAGFGQDNQPVKAGSRA
ncbi:MAG TPA: PilZ domain-containing protein [Phycisphaerae bacterium]|nr:PilZ domain-containing protein [Phycisphaerae bacterium]